MRMANPSFARLENRGLLAVRGEDARTFLQGLISNDIRRVTDDRAIHAAFLTAQGKFLHEFFVVPLGETLMLDCEAGRAADLARRLSLYRLRSKVTVEQRTADYLVAAVFGEEAGQAFQLNGEAGDAAAFAGGVVYRDPRLAAAGVRAILPREGGEEALGRMGFAEAPFAAYDAHRLALGLPDGSRDLVVEKTILLEAGFDEFNGVDWQKGCFLGQELTARTKYRGLIKRRLLPVRFDGPAPAAGTPILLDGRDVGEMRSSAPGIGLALLRLESLEAAAGAGTALMAGDIRLVPEKPSWARI
ncbi:CAF17-like 4Fe-4S cluster assembly/insertion protein YgfZ [Shumkonia mesophila]|uniref:CAF17-like 4Fe-4S cluster assembly/insertion protein YgfZ n=1 Tax=Shumkonia mesophila TaxID=2838854 RepID=UPI002934B3A6|nr:folate-binding protein [Shumkonia mesophila]